MDCELSRVLCAAPAGDPGGDIIKRILVCPSLPAAVGVCVRASCVEVNVACGADDITPALIGVDADIGEFKGTHPAGILFQEIFRENCRTANKATVLHADVVGTRMGPVSCSQVLKPLLHGGVAGFPVCSTTQQHPIPAARLPVVGKQRMSAVPLAGEGSAVRFVQRIDLFRAYHRCVSCGIGAVNIPERQNGVALFPFGPLLQAPIEADDFIIVNRHISIAQAGIVHKAIEHTAIGTIGDMVRLEIHTVGVILDPSR